MSTSLHHPHESSSNTARDLAGRYEPRALRTYTPSQAVLARSAGIYHWTPEGRRLYDFTSGVLVSNLGHNPTGWMRAFARYMNWPPDGFTTQTTVASEIPHGYTPAVAMTAYNAVTPVEVEASWRLLATLRKSPGGSRMEQVMWAASGSEAIQKALWAAMPRDRGRPMILATRLRV